MGGIFLLFVWPVTGLELWGLRRSNRALGISAARKSHLVALREGLAPTVHQERARDPHCEESSFSGLTTGSSEAFPGRLLGTHTVPGSL